MRLGSGGGTRTRDPTIMSRVLLPTELLRHVEAGPRARPGSPLTDSNRRPLPYHGSALPTELRGQGPARIAGAARRPPRTPSRADRVPCMRTRLVERARRRGDPRRSTTSRSLESTVTFDLVPRTLDDQVAWIDEHSGGHPAIVAVDDDDEVRRLRVALAVPARARRTRRPSRTRSTCTATRRGDGVGALLLERARRPGTRPRLPLGRSPASSAATTRRSRCTQTCGFEQVGVEREVGRKFGRGSTSS